MNVELHNGKLIRISEIYEPIGNYYLSDYIFYDSKYLIVYAYPAEGSS